MDLNVKPQTLVETFDQANSNSIPECMSRQCLTLTFLDTRQWASE